MSQAAVKASRRQIRRAFGPVAIDTVDSLIAEHKTHAGALQVQHAALASHTGTLAALEARVFALEQIQRRPFMGRLRWLATGR